MQSNLLKFFGNPFGSEVDLPEELKNEPFTYRDNGLIAEIVKEREAFLFKIHRQGIASVSSGRDMRRDAIRSKEQVPSKNSSNISVVTVYDTYGIDVTYSYLKYLYQYSANHPHWITTYLEGSLMVLRPEVAAEGEMNNSALALCSLIFLDLAYLDSKQPKSNEPLTTVDTNLPREILSLLLPSDRIAKSVTNARLETRCDKLPTTRELAAFNQPSQSPIYLYPTGEYAKIVVVDKDRMECVMRPTGSDSSWSIEIVKNPLDELDLTTARIVAYPIIDYDYVFVARGCGLEATITTLQDLKRRMSRATEANIREVSAWHMSLLWFEFNSVQERTEIHIGSFVDLKKELLEMINNTINDWKLQL